MRTEIFYKSNGIDGRLRHLRESLTAAGFNTLGGLAIADVYITKGEDIPEVLLKECFSDPVAQEALCGKAMAETSLFPEWNCLVEVSYLPGVTNPLGMTAKSALENALIADAGTGRRDDIQVQTARQYLIQAPDLTGDDWLRLASVLYNPLIEKAVIISRKEWEKGVRPPESYPPVANHGVMPVESFDLSSLGDQELLDFSRKRLLALNLAEMKAIQAWFDREEVKKGRREKGLPEGPTDVELEMLAQTWSEHCKHKILNARVFYTEGQNTEEINSLFKTYIKGTTDALLPVKPFLKSLFHDNSGVIEFDENNLICFKAETHNSPSALDPYGGAITGIVGVNRDILGTGKGARPIFNTNVLCFGEPDTPDTDVPQGLLHPKRIMQGVHKGIIDGGNQSGIPTVAGAFLFDESYMGKPLVFCGTGGIIPRKVLGEDGWIKHINAGDLAVMLGGRIGKDGIHGATFSSLALDEESPTSAVQIGDPITQKKMSDFLMEARDLGLYKGITDNGAGGLSSSLGEMAESSGGIRVDIEKCPLKYQGLAPWEIWVSESQERMSLAIAPETIEAFLELAARRDVEATVIGEFTSSGNVELFYDKKPAARMSLDFLHNGLPVMEVAARWVEPERTEGPRGEKKNSGALLLSLLAEPNIASKESLIRQYDHEVQIQSVQKPFVGRDSDAPSDGAVLRPVRDSFRGLTVTHGICPRYSEIDTYHMAACAVDEAFRAHIAMGGDPDFCSALDNFCWPDPIESDSTPDGAYKMAQMVRACKGLQDACLAYGVPLISGKDSMKNDAQLGGKKVSVKPTLLISLMGIIRDYRKTISSDFKEPGDLILAAGATRGELAGTYYQKLTGGNTGEVPQVHFGEALALYKSLHEAMDAGLVKSCHDLSDGGLGVAMAESVLGGGLGAEADLSLLPGGPEMEAMDEQQLLFCETPSRFLLTIDPENLDDFMEIMAGQKCAVLGSVSAESLLKINRMGKPVLELPLEDLKEAWQKPFGPGPQTPRANETLKKNNSTSREELRHE